MRRTPLALVSSAALVAVLSACSSGSTTSGSASSTPASSAATSSAASATGSAAAPSGSTGASTSPTTTGPALPAGTALPTASGSFGDKPTLTFPTKSGPPTKTTTKILHQGTGKVVAKNDLLVADYLGQVWGGKVFDNSYDRKAPTGFTIGAGKVIPGWDSTLVGVKAGTRIELSIPPADGYGSAGQAQAGIKGTDTLVFVVDVIASYDKSSTGDPKAAVETLPANGPQVTGAMTGSPKITIPGGAPQPTAPKATIVDKGSGKAVTAGTIVVQYNVISWDGQAVDSTWTTGSPAAYSITADNSGGPFDQLQGMPIGSRVLLTIPASSQPGASASASPTTTPAFAAVLDIVAEVPEAKDATIS